MSVFSRNVPLLAVCQALMMSSTTLVVSTSALVGYALAEDKAYATLPFALQLIATMLTSLPAALLMKKIGRKRGFMLATTGASMGMEVQMFFTFWGLNIVKKNEGGIKSKGFFRKMLNLINRGGAKRQTISKFNMLGLGTWMMKKSPGIR